jgi:hypothetical protein
VEQGSGRRTITRSGFVDAFSMLAFLRPHTALKYFIYLGYPGTPATSALSCVRGRNVMRLLQKGYSLRRRVYRCVLVGTRGCGVREFMRSVAGAEENIPTVSTSTSAAPHTDTATATTAAATAATTTTTTTTADGSDNADEREPSDTVDTTFPLSVAAHIGETSTPHTLILTHMSGLGESAAERVSALRSVDLCVICYDANDAGSFASAAQTHRSLSHLPCLLLATRGYNTARISETAGGVRQQGRAYTRALGLSSPLEWTDGEGNAGSAEENAGNVEGRRVCSALLDAAMAPESALVRGNAEGQTAVSSGEHTRLTWTRLLRRSVTMGLVSGALAVSSILLHKKMSK